MRSLAVISALLLSMVFTSCTQNNPEMTSPVEPQILGNSSGFEAECHANMRTIASMEVIYFAQHGEYTYNLEDLGMAGVVCPECESRYLLTIYDEGYAFKVECPLQCDPNHGNIDNGVASWSEGSGGFQNMCRARMRTIASQEVIYFANHSRYTESLEELGMAGTVCPQCGESHILLVSGEGDEFFVGCPIDGWGNHGNINNGVASWIYPGSEE